MAVEALTIINGPLAGVEENGVVNELTTWMRSNGIKPAYVGIGALVGALMSRRGLAAGAVVGAAIAFTSQAAWHQIR